MITDATRILTNEGYLTPSQIQKQGDVLFLCPDSGIWVNGFVSSADWGEYWTYTLAPLNNAGKSRTWKQQLARPTKLNLVDGFTYDLRVKDVLPANMFDAGYHAGAWASGFMYRLDIQHADSLRPEKYPLYQDRLNTLILTNQLDRRPTVPGKDDSPAVKGSFIKGYLAASGNTGRLETPDCDIFNFFIENHGFAGAVLTGGERTFRKKLTTKEGVRFYNLSQITYCKGHSFKGFKVTDINGPSEKQVNLYQVHLDKTGSYVLEGGWTAIGA